MNKTKQFIELATKIYQFDQNNPNMEKEWLTMMSKFCGGICGRCNKTLKVIKVKTNFQGRKFFFKCGHMYGLSKVDDKTTTIRDPKRTFEKASIFLSSDAPQVEAHHSGPKIQTYLDELGVARKFIEIAYPTYQKIKKFEEESSLVDIVAENENNGEKIFMQVTKLYPADFWKDFHTLKSVKINEPIEPLLIKAIERKSNFDQNEKRKTILLIDSWPGFEQVTIGQLSLNLKRVIKTAGYKEIWIVGSIEQLSFRIDID